MTEARIDRPQAHTPEQAEATHIDNLKFAMWLFLASEVVLFAVMIATYIVFRIHNAEVVHEIHEQTGVWLVTLNTFLLLTSSWTMVMGLRAIQNGDQKVLVRQMLITAALGAVFVFMQYVEYNALAAEGVTIYGSTFGMRFYAPTALHGAHVIAGIIWALWVARRGAQGVYNNGHSLGVEIFGLYWHFVDVVWILLFTVIYLL